MEVRVCKNCRRLFKYIYGPELCQECNKIILKEKEQSKQNSTPSLKPLIKEEEELFEQVKDYIIHNPKATVVHIADVHKITPIKLLEWIRDERLEFSEDSTQAWFECSKCGTRIKSGRLCNRCKF